MPTLLHCPHATLRAIFTSTVLLLAACSPVSEFQRPEPPIPKAWPITDGKRGKTDATNTHWRTFFRDPRLHSLIETALEHNRDLRIAVARVEEARAQYGIARTDRLPAVNLVGSATIARTPSELSGVGNPSNSQRYDLSLATVSFELDFWGRLSGQSEVARAGYLATQEAQRAVHLTLVADVASAYFNLLQMDELLSFAQANVELHEESLALTAKGHALGAVGDAELQQVAGLLEESRGSVAAMEHQRSIAITRLHLLTGTVPEQLPPGRTLSEQGIETELITGVPSEVLLMRPDVIASEQRLLAAHANIGAARAAFLPKILLSTGLGIASQGLAGLFSSGGAWSFQPSISLPLFDGGRVAANVDVAEARKIIAVAEYERTLQQAFREVADLLSARSALTKQLAASISYRDSQKRRLEIAQGRFVSGMISYVEVLHGQGELIAARQSTAQLRHAQLATAAQLYKALGGGG